MWLCAHSHLFSYLNEDQYLFMAISVRTFGKVRTFFHIFAKLCLRTVLCLGNDIRIRCRYWFVVWCNTSFINICLSCTNVSTTKLWSAGLKQTTFLFKGSGRFILSSCKNMCKHWVKHYFASPRCLTIVLLCAPRTQE